MVVVFDSFKDWSVDNENDKGAVEWFRQILVQSKCDICGELVLDRKPFLWWHGQRDVIICDDCAEHTISGLSRDLAELKGDKDAVHKIGEVYNPILLKADKEKLQNRILLNLKKIVELQNILSRPT